MAVKLNGTGRAFARSLIRAGKVDKTSAWSFSAEDGNALLGPDGDDWANFGKHHLGVDDAEGDETKAHWKYPFGKDGKLYRSALIAIRDRAGQQHDQAIFDAAGDLLDAVDGKDTDEDGARAAIASARAGSPALLDLYSRLVMTAGERLLLIDEGRALHAAREAAEANQVRPTQVALLPLMGPLFPRGRSFGTFATSMESFRAQLAGAVANPDVGAIVIDVDSPGGTYAGTPETAAAVRAAAQVKPVTAVIDSLGASAAYFIASQAGQLVVSPSADVGSIGVLAVHLDFSQALENDGVRPTIVRSVPFKAEGNLFEPLTAEAKAYLQADVDQAHDVFVRAVAEGRKVSQAKVRDEFGKGRTVSAAKAVELGMADRVGTMGDVLAGVRTKHGFRRRSALAFV